MPTIYLLFTSVRSGVRVPPRPLEQRFTGVEVACEPLFFGRKSNLIPYN